MRLFLPCACSDVSVLFPSSRLRASKPAQELCGCGSFVSSSDIVEKEQTKASKTRNRHRAMGQCLMDKLHCMEWHEPTWTTVRNLNELRQRRHAKSWAKHLPTRGFIEKLNISMSIERYYLYACFHLLLKCTMSNQHMGICNTSNHRTI